MRLAAVMLAGAAAVACAGSPGENSPPSSPALADGRSLPPKPRPSCQRVFISPSGEPFRRAPGAACPLEVWFAGADTDHDGSLGRSEFKADAARFFGELDVNGDRVLEPEEVRRYEQQVAPEILGRSQEARLGGRLILTQFGGGGGTGGGGGRGGGRHHQSGETGQPHGTGQGGSPDGASRYGLLDEPEPVASADLNFDGRISYDEFLTRASQRFDSLDAESSGRLTLAALEARLANRGGDRQRPGSSPSGRGHRA